MTAKSRTSDDVTCSQAKRIFEQTRPPQGYLCRLRERMERVGFWQHDPLFLKVSRAYDALHSLNTELHYLSVPFGVGKPPRKKD